MRHIASIRKVLASMALMVSFSALVSCLGEPWASMHITFTDAVLDVPLEGVKVECDIHIDRTDTVYSDDKGEVFLVWPGGPSGFVIHITKTGYKPMDFSVKKSDFIGDPWAQSWLTLSLALEKE